MSKRVNISKIKNNLKYENNKKHNKFIINKENDFIKKEAEEEKAIEIYKRIGEV